MRKSLWMIFKWGLVLIATLLVTMFGCVVLFLARPELILTQERVEKLLRRKVESLAEAEHAAIRWDQFHFRIDSLSFLKKKIEVGFNGLCVDQGDSAEIHGCIHHFGTSIVVSAFPPRLLELGPTDLKAQRLFARLASQPQSAKQKADHRQGNAFPAFLSKARIHPLSMDIGSWEVISGKNDVRGNLRGTSGEQEGHFWASFSSDVSVQKERLKIRAGVRASEGKFNLVLNASTLNPVRGVSKVVVKDCSLGSSSAADTRGAVINLECPVHVFLSEIQGDLSRAQFPKKMDFKIVADLRAKEFPPDLSQPLQGRIDFDLLPFLTPVFKGEGRVSAKFDGIPSELGRKGKLETRIDTQIGIHHFGRLVNALRATQWEIPTPLDVLKGTIYLDTHGAFDPRSGRFPLTLLSRLGSPTEKLNIDVAGVVTLDHGSGLFEARVVPSDINLELPQLGLSVLPRMTPDHRIETRAEARQEAGEVAKKSQPGSFHYQVTVQTPSDHPITIRSNLAKAPIPIYLDLVLTDRGPPSGRIHVASFPVELFRRDVKMDHLNVGLQSPMDESSIDGLLRLRYVDYTVSIQLEQTVGKPVVHFASDPPLPDSDIIATLLFGHPLNALDSDQTDSVGNTRSAVADGAMGLASLYALASTPIESVGYDPTTHSVLAKVKVGEGMSLNLGTNSQTLSQTGLRKRLGPHWSVETDVNNPTDPVQRTLSAFLDWSLRY